MGGRRGERHNMILGHEGCAEVVEVGSEVKDFKPGDQGAGTRHNAELELP